MNRFFKWVLGTRPEAGIYYIDGASAHEKTITEEDISASLVHIPYEHLPDSYLTFREFHALYTQYSLKAKFEKGE
jgi:hypothetical protein